jgi:hypothetical protein
MNETDHIHPEIRKFASETGAEEVRSMSGVGGRVDYGDDYDDIINVGKDSKVPEGFRGHLTFNPTPSIDLWPRD